MFSVKGKRVLITGSSGNIGKTLCRGFSQEGACVYQLDNRFDRTNEFLFVCDLELKGEIKRIVEKIKGEIQTIDVLVNCAGITIEGYEEQSFERTLKVNLVAPFLLTKELIPIMSKNASVINITSLNADLAFPNNPAYMSSKGALKQLSKSLAYDFGKRGIRVNNVVPGYIKTAMTMKSWKDKEKRKQREDRTLLGRWGTPEDLVGPVLFLASDASSYMTGTDLVVDGGWSTKGL